MRDFDNKIYSTVIRVNYEGKGEIQTLRDDLLHVGDIIRLQVGQVLPVDCLLLSGDQLQMGEAEMTLEEGGVNKAPLTQDNFGRKPLVDPFLFSGTTCVAGGGLAVACTVGESTR